MVPNGDSSFMSIKVNSSRRHENLHYLPGDKTSGLYLVGDCFLDLTNFFPMNFDFLVSKMGGNANR